MAGQRKTKKRNFTEVEVETLVGEVEARKEILFGGHGIGITNIKKKNEWQHVAAAVNAVSGTERTVPELKKKWSDIKVGAKQRLSSHRQSVTATGGGPSTPDLTPIDRQVASIIGTASVSGIVSEREGDTDNTEEQESAVGGEEDDDAGEGPSAAGHPAAPTPSTKRQSAGRVLTDEVLQLQRETICSQQLD
ncbi:nuclear apoptosis-inducing factor 1-like [Gadus chalcogrammus]|uniref:nuclear apoptosis-inducing factor 1-like n=1 Tax=Gadus chalcogrammus TaxID=1042646 RepID=UPI0024C4B77E|nr:nuclear apoptosis-inducing factor 1-like [Gadus chalcogrammus]